MAFLWKIVHLYSMGIVLLNLFVFGLKDPKVTRGQLRSIVKSLFVLSDRNTSPLGSRTWKLTVMINIHFPMVYGKLADLIFLILGF